MTRRVRESELDAMRQRAERAESDNAELRAHAKRLREAAIHYMNAANKDGKRRIETREQLETIIYESEVQSLAEIRAEAVEKAASEFLSGVDAGNKDETAADASVRVYKLLKKIREGKE